MCRFCAAEIYLSRILKSEAEKKKKKIHQQINVARKSSQTDD